MGQTAGAGSGGDRFWPPTVKIQRIRRTRTRGGGRDSAAMVERGKGR